jgi:hypothetical protein
LGHAPSVAARQGPWQAQLGGRLARSMRSPDLGRAARVEEHVTLSHRRLLGEQPGASRASPDRLRKRSLVAARSRAEVRELGVVAAPLAHPVEALQDAPAICGRDRDPRAGAPSSAVGGQQGRTSSSSSDTDAGRAGRRRGARRLGDAQRDGAADRRARLRGDPVEQRAGDARAPVRAGGRCRRRARRRRAGTSSSRSSGTTSAAGIARTRCRRRSPTRAHSLARRAAVPSGAATDEAANGGLATSRPRALR